jgi:uncharacterized membrane protein (UPF0127 family)
MIFKNSKLRVLWIAFIFAFAVVNCAARGGEKPQDGLETRRIGIAAAAGTVWLDAELARTDKQHAAGLMYRNVLADGKGMLFIFENDEVRSFWMKNTVIPLSIAYILYDGTILEIRDMHPGDLSSVHSSRSVRYALEVPQGWFGRAGVTPGNRLDVSGL